MAIFEIATERIKRLKETTFQGAGFGERSDLQRLLRDQIDVIAPGIMVLSEEFGDWQDSRRRTDMLGLDRDANLVVFELKRTENGGHMELQAIRSAAMVSMMTFEVAVETFAKFLRRIGRTDDAKATILQFLGWEAPDEERFAQDVRIVLVAADFSTEVTTSVMWMNEHDHDIRCVRMKSSDDRRRLSAAPATSVRINPPAGLAGSPSCCRISTSVSRCSPFNATRPWRIVTPTPNFVLADRWPSGRRRV